MYYSYAYKSSQERPSIDFLFRSLVLLIDVSEVIISRTNNLSLCLTRSPNQQSRGSRSPLPPNNNNNDPTTSTPSTTGLFGKNYEKLVLYCETKRIRLEIESKENNVTMLKLSYPKLKPIFERLFKGNSVENAANNALQQIQ